MQEKQNKEFIHYISRKQGHEDRTEDKICKYVRMKEKD